jgi:glycosyltransferase involved in cell wall biosynthesis
MKDEARMELPRISVVTCSFNQAQYLEATIKSVLDQKYPNLEYIIIDGGSEDGSVEIIKKYSERLAYWVSEPDKGQTDALIKGFERASGEILAWLCSDDLYEPYTLHEVANAFLQNPQWRVVYGDSVWIDSDNHFIRPKKEIGFNRFIWLYEGSNYIPQPSTFWRREVYDQVGGLHARWEHAMDADLWIRFAEVTHLHHVPRRWSRMRDYPEQKNRQWRKEANAEGALILGRYLPEEPRWKRRLKYIVAKSLRVAAKVARGAYW